MSSFRSKSSKDAKHLRIAIVDKGRCKPEKCNRECLTQCPVNRRGNQCVTIESIDIEDLGNKKKISKISQQLCIGCGICVKVCPFNAIQMVNLPSEIASELTHSYGENSFRLYRLPIPKKGKIVGFIGQNGIGKSTIMSILSGKLRPNYGNYQNPPDINDILKEVRGSTLQPYLQSIYSKEFTIRSKVQHVDKLLKKFQESEDPRTVEKVLSKRLDNENEFHLRVVGGLGLNEISQNEVRHLSGGELQRLMCAMVLLTTADVYIFDEPSNFLDIHYRMVVADLIGELADENRYIFVVEHDMSILDYACDAVHVIYGQPGAYGVVSSIQSTAPGINTYFSGYIASDNVRFRPEPFVFKDRLTLESESTLQQSTEQQSNYNYNSFQVKFDCFELYVAPGQVSTSSLIILAGRNGMGKTTFLKEFNERYSNLIISHKSQYLFGDLPNGVRTVREYLFVPNTYINDPVFKTDVLNTLEVGLLYDRNIRHLSGGELQRVQIVKALSRQSNVYLIDEPSACLDIEQRVRVTKALKRFTAHYKKTVFVVEHDIMMAMGLGMETTSRIIVFGENKNLTDRAAIASSPQMFIEGISSFLKGLNVTFRTSEYSHTSRPRINKIGSRRDLDQKRKNIYYE